MLRHTLPGVDLSLSVFSFGTASLHHLKSEADRQNLLFRAADAGFSHFDTAPLYGFGMAERSLAPLLAAQPDLTVATKVGLYPPGGACQSRWQMLARKVAGKALPAISLAQVDWSVDRARKSFESSLKRIGRDFVNILFLHEPVPNLIVTDELLGWLETISGRFRYVGVAGLAEQVAPYLAEDNPFGVIVQTADSLSGREAEVVLNAGRPLQFTFGYVSADPKVPAEQTLADALKRNHTGSVLVSTRHHARIDQYARLGA